MSFSDKLIWRRAGVYNLLAHCFRKKISLCGRYQIIGLQGGQAATRPDRAFRCGACERLEMQRRKWTKPGPVTGKSELVDARKVMCR